MAITLDNLLSVDISCLHFNLVTFIFLKMKQIRFRNIKFRDKKIAIIKFTRLFFNCNKSSDQNINIITLYNI